MLPLSESGKHVKHVKYPYFTLLYFTFLSLLCFKPTFRGSNFYRCDNYKTPVIMQETYLKRTAVCPCNESVLSAPVYLVK